MSESMVPFLAGAAPSSVPNPGPGPLNAEASDQPRSGSQAERPRLYPFPASPTGKLHARPVGPACPNRATILGGARCAGWTC